MLKIYSTCCLFGSCLFSVGVRNNNVVNFLFFPFELSACVCNNLLVSATAGEKCDTDISPLRYDSPEISAYSSNQNSDPQLTSACVALWQSADVWSDQDNGTIGLRADFFFFFFQLNISQIRRLGISRTLHGAIIQQYVLIRSLRSTFPWTRACLLLMSHLSRPPPLPSRPCSGRDEMERRSVNQQRGFAVIKCSGGGPFWEHKIKMMPRTHLRNHLMWVPLPFLGRVPQNRNTRSNVCSWERLLDDEWDIGLAHHWARLKCAPLTARQLIRQGPNICECKLVHFLWLWWRQD